MPSDAKPYSSARAMGEHFARIQEQRLHEIIMRRENQMPNNVSTELEAGDRVKHDSIGVGTVATVDEWHKEWEARALLKDDECIVRFDHNGHTARVHTKHLTRQNNRTDAEEHCFIYDTGNSRITKTGPTVFKAEPCGYEEVADGVVIGDRIQFKKSGNTGSIVAEKEFEKQWGEGLNKNRVAYRIDDHCAYSDRIGGIYQASPDSFTNLSRQKSTEVTFKNGATLKTYGSGGLIKKGELVAFKEGAAESVIPIDRNRRVKVSMPGETNEIKNLTINTLDSESFAEFAKRNMGAIERVLGITAESTCGTPIKGRVEMTLLDEVDKWDNGAECKQNDKWAIKARAKDGEPRFLVPCLICGKRVFQADMSSHRAEGECYPEQDPVDLKEQFRIVKFAMDEEAKYDAVEHFRQSWKKR